MCQDVAFIGAKDVVICHQNVRCEMKFRVQQISQGEDELILRYRQMNSEVKEILTFMERRERKLAGKIDGETVFFLPEEILYIEKVDEKTFAYTTEQVIQMDVSLSMAELMLDDIRFFRCSKSMILNVNRVERLKSLPSNRIDATLQNGEHIMISRTYASEFRNLLRGEYIQVRHRRTCRETRAPKEFSSAHLKRGTPRLKVVNCFARQK